MFLLAESYGAVRCGAVRITFFCFVLYGVERFGKKRIAPHRTLIVANKLVSNTLYLVPRYPTVRFCAGFSFLIILRYHGAVRRDFVERRIVRCGAVR